MQVTVTSGPTITSTATGPLRQICLLVSLTFSPVFPKFTLIPFAYCVAMEPFSWRSGWYSSSSARMSSGFLVNPEIRNGSTSYSGLVLDGVRGELREEAPVKLDREEVSTERTTKALKNHREVEKKRRARINAHLDTLRSLVLGAKKMDKASILAEVISHLKQMQRKASEVSEDSFIPKDIDELRVEQGEGGLDGTPYSIRVSLCCENKPGLLSDIRQALDSLHLIIMKAKIATLGGRMKSVFVMTSCKEENNGGDEVHQLLASSVHQALRSILDKFSASQEFFGTTLSNKRQRISMFNSSKSSSLGDIW